MLTKKELASCLFAVSSADKEQLLVISKAWKKRLNTIQYQATFSLHENDTVNFKNRFGEVIEGVILKINVKTVNVKDKNGMTWKVAPTLLTVIKRNGVDITT